MDATTIGRIRADVRVGLGAAVAYIGAVALLLLVCVALAWSVWFRPSGGGPIDRAPIATPTACSTSAGDVPCS